MIDLRALERLKETIGNDPEDLVEMIESFLQEAPSLVADMGTALDMGDRAALQRNAHSLKSNARDFGATNLADLCHSVEEHLRSGGEPDHVRECVASILEEWNRVQPALHTEVSRIRTPQ